MEPPKNLAAYLSPPPTFSRSAQLERDLEDPGVLERRDPLISANNISANNMTLMTSLAFARRAEDVPEHLAHLVAHELVAAGASLPKRVR